MQAAETSARQDQTAPVPEGTRRCLVTGEVLPKEGLIRFAVSPDNIVTPDLAQNLPGRGMWVKASRDSIDEAARKNLFSKAAKTSVQAPADLVDRVAGLLHKRCLDFLGLARRSGIVVIGQPQVEGELKAGRLAVLLLADDASDDLGAYRGTRDLPRYRRFSRNELGAALGHDQLVYVGLKAHSLADRLREDLARLENIAIPHHIA